MPMYGWQAAAQIDLVPNKLAISGGYSMAEVCRRNGAYADDEYRRGQYVFGNIFWDSEGGIFYGRLPDAAVRNFFGF